MPKPIHNFTSKRRLGSGHPGLRPPVSWLRAFQDKLRQALRHAEGHEVAQGAVAVADAVDRRVPGRARQAVGVLPGTERAAKTCPAGEARRWADTLAPSLWGYT
jgi:hypothetical protein